MRYKVTFFYPIEVISKRTDFPIRNVVRYADAENEYEAIKKLELVEGEEKFITSVEPSDD